jgi:hypothetical protein
VGAKRLTEREEIRTVRKAKGIEGIQEEEIKEGMEKRQVQRQEVDLQIDHHKVPKVDQGTDPLKERTNLQEIKVKGGIEEKKQKEEIEEIGETEEIEIEEKKQKEEIEGIEEIEENGIEARGETGTKKISRKRRSQRKGIGADL